MAEIITTALEAERSYYSMLDRLSSLPVSAQQALMLFKINGVTPLSALGQGSRITYHLKALVEDGYVRRDAGRDRRAVIVSLTPAGQRVRTLAIRALGQDAGADHV